MEDTEYPKPTCMECWKICEIVEYHNVGTKDEEMWVWCKECKIDTFHKPIKNS